MSSHSYVIIGKIGKAFGLKGWVKIFSYTQPADQILDYSPLFIQQNGQWQLFHCDGYERRRKDILFHPKDCQTPEQTASYCHGLIAVAREQLPNLADDEYYWADLKGLTVVNQQGIELGVVDYLLETASNDILVVKGKRTYHVPYIRQQVVLTIDLNNKLMQVDWDENF